MRKAHILKHNSKVERITHCIFFDTETKVVNEYSDSMVHKLRLGVATYCRFDTRSFFVDWLIFRDPKEFWDWLVSKLKPKITLYVFAHNLAFDFAVVGGQHYLMELGADIKQVCWEDRRSIIRVKIGKTGVIFVDSLNILPFSIAELGRMLGLPKLKVDFNFVMDHELIEYCKRDVEILGLGVKSFYDFISTNGLGSRGLTLAQQAFKVFRHKFMKHEIYIHNNLDVMSLEDLAYMGGRCEAFYIGEVKKRVYKLDVNSMYPYIMQNNYFPVKLVKYFRDGCDLDTLKKLLMDYCVIARVKLKTTEPAFAVRHGDKLIFPIGEFETVLTTPSLKYAIRNGYIMNVLEVAVYEKEIIFKEYVEYFYKKRQEYKAMGNKVFEVICKLLLNSLYGKFGQRQRDVIVLEGELANVYGNSDYIVFPDGRRFYVRRYFDKLYLTRNSRLAGWDAFTAIAAHVTDYSRMYLWWFIKLSCGLTGDYFKNSDVLYCDTDSLFVTEAGFNRLANYISDNELGKLKLEGTADRLVIYGAKDYEFGNEIKIKGIRKTAVYLGDNTYVQEVFPSLVRVLKEKMDGYVEIRKVIKRLRRKYDKGVVMPDGYVCPIVLG